MVHNLLSVDRLVFKIDKRCVRYCMMALTLPVSR